MMYQTIGRYPTVTMGLGTDSECARSRAPPPPQKITPFIATATSCSSSGTPSSGPPALPGTPLAANRPRRASRLLDQVSLEPLLPPAVLVLLPAPPAAH